MPLIGRWSPLLAARQLRRCGDACKPQSDDRCVDGGPRWRARSWHA